MGFTKDSFGVDVPDHQLAAFDAAWAWLASPGGSWTGAEKVAIAEVVRAARARPIWDRRPTAIDHLDATLGPGTLSPLVVDTVERISVEPGSIDREWAEAVIDVLGAVAYAELVAVVATVVPIDRGCALLDREAEPLPTPVPGATTGEHAEAIVDIGAFIPVAAGFGGANVAKSLSIAPTANMARLRVVRALYSGERFGELRWEDGALDRPQVELLAARTSALNECFY
jgi:hypothetical protein